MKDRQSSSRESHGDKSKDRDIRTDEKRQGGNTGSGSGRQGSRESGTGTGRGQ